MFNLIRRIWDPNALGGQFATLMMGIAVTIFDAVFYHRLPEGEPLVICVALLIIPPFFLPARGYDHSEKWQKFMINFGTSYFFGVLIGMGPAHMLAHELEKEMLTVSGISAIADTILVCFAYWSTGHLSRVFVQEVAYRFGKLPPSVSKLVAALILMNFQTEARNLTIAAITLNLKEAARIIADVEEAVLEAAADDSHRNHLRRLADAALQEIGHWWEQPPQGSH